MDRHRIFVADAQPAFADAVAALLSTAGDLQPTGTATDAVTAVAVAARTRPDVIAVDLDLGGSELVRALATACPRSAVVVVAAADNPNRAIDAIWSGARGWVSKTAPASQLFEVLRLAAQGQSWFPPQLLAEILRELVAVGPLRHPRSGPLAALTPREYDVLLCLVDGLNRKATSERLCLSVNTVRTHIQSLFAKLGVHNTLEAVAVALAADVRSSPVADPPRQPVRRLTVVPLQQA